MSTHQKLEIQKKTYGIAIGCIAMSAVLLLMARNRAVPTQVVDVSMEEKAQEYVRDCTLDECYSSGCNAESAPYMCVRHNGGPHGGCSPGEWIWWTCDDQCTIEKCADMEIPEDTASCANIECGDDWCNGGQTCGPDVPYQCKNGSARFGCSADVWQWTLYTGDATCSDCCDSTTC